MMCTLRGYQNEVLVTLSNLTASLQQIGLTIREDKCNLYFPIVLEHFCTDIYMSKDGISVLGHLLALLIMLHCMHRGSITGQRFFFKD